VLPVAPVPVVPEADETCTLTAHEAAARATAPQMKKK
jgi:hypothetical protein